MRHSLNKSIRKYNEQSKLVTKILRREKRLYKKNKVEVNIETNYSTQINFSKFTGR